MMKREQMKTVRSIAPKLLALAVASAAAMPVMADSDFHAYLRSGIGSSMDGGDQVCYQAGGAPAKYRLGNECETYAAMRMIHPIASTGKASFKVTTELGYYTDQDKDFETMTASNPASEGTEAGDKIVLRRFNVAGTDVIEALPGATLWVGKEFVSRQDSNINDFFFWDPKGPGVGLNNVDVGFGKLAVAWTRNGSTDGVDGNGIDGNVVNNSYDIRVSNIAVTETSNLEAGIDFGTSRGTDGYTYEGANNNGLLVSVNYNQTAVLGGTNKFTVQYGKDGMTSDSSNGNQDGTLSGKLVRVLDQGVTKLADNLEAQYVVIYQKRDNDNAANGGYKWLSAGVRPVYQWGGYTSTAVELGLDQVKPLNDGFADTKMTKLTVAQQFSLAPTIMARPTLRLFATYAKWDDNGNKNSEGITPDGKTNGLSIGAQTEVWF
ncbi:maltoporin [Parathalassolituus penaei]|uniref:Carbohydrate porin n=1 Tax=Parathalassolituus penaei TaxID=2997323 RepID=A0A9X3IUJ3_9GAMM|nr:carbohydrate porin [Parathalassolituus penaei]MCY0967014.1 carbohydrate porin [Parathalassolituus penaei]